MPSNVWFASAEYDRFDANVTLPAKFTRMLEKMQLGADWSNKSVVVKMHVGRGVGYTTIHPLFVKIVCDHLKAQGARPFVADQSIEGAKIRGYTEDILGVPVLDVCGHLGKYYYEKNIQYKTFTHVDIAGLIHDADAMVDLSHVKGHGACGYGGACKNIAMGCVTDRTRQEIHRLEGGLEWNADRCIHCDQCISSCNHHANSFDEAGQYKVFYHDCTFCQHCVKVCPVEAITLNDGQYVDFQTGMALCTKSVLDTFAPGHVQYINVMTNMTALCDCWGLSTPALVPDVGILASDDIVAIERACLDHVHVEDLIPGSLPTGYELGKEGHLFERVHHKNPFIQLDQLASLGLGNAEYTLIPCE